MKLYYAGFIPSENNTISVIFPDFPGCSTFGKNREHAFIMAIDALSTHIQALEQSSVPTPDPSPYEAAWENLYEEIADYDMGPLPKATLMHPVPAILLDIQTEYPLHEHLKKPDIPEILTMPMDSGDLPLYVIKHIRKYSSTVLDLEDTD